jgi:hypothetical protein
VSVDFQPVRVGRQRRRVDPLAVGVVGVVIALAVAIGKPWDPQGDPRRSAPSSAAVVPSAGPSVGLATSPTAVSKPLAAKPAVARPPSWADLAGVVPVRDDWGVRVLLHDRPTLYGAPAVPRYVERWSPAKADATGVETARFATDDRSIELLGVTAPLAESPQAVRIWRIHRDDRLEWIAATPVDPTGPDGSLLYFRPGVGDAPVVAWEAGRYRIDVLVSTGIRRITVEVPGRFEHVPVLDSWSSQKDGILPASAADPPTVLTGMYASVDGVGVPLGAVAHGLLTETEAWREVIRSGGLGSGVIVASAYLPRASGLGVMLPSRAEVKTATLLRLAPNGSFEPTPILHGNSDHNGRRPFVLFEAPPGGVWAPGVYAISITWSDGVAQHHETWHVELRPGRG